MSYSGFFSELILRRLKRIKELETQIETLKLRESPNQVTQQNVQPNQNQTIDI